jgi:polyhydroxyalkanoate synthesis repressor PhaR
MVESRRFGSCHRERHASASEALTQRVASGTVTEAGGARMETTPNINEPPSPRVIKRYANRKLYDTERSCYVTLEEISQMIKEGEDVRVVDNKTKDDLTAVTLAQIIVEEEKKVQKMPLKLLRSIIQSGNEAFSNFSVGKIKDDAQRRVETLWKREKGEGKEDAADDAAREARDAAHDDATRQSVMQEFVNSTTEAFETWQKRIDERVKEAFAKSPARPHGVDVDGLKRRIDELEGKIKELEAKKAQSPAQG